jgi:flagellar biosynthetic protein FliR
MSSWNCAELEFWLRPWLGHVSAFTLVLVRVSGVLSVGPLLGQSILPWQARIGAAVILSMLLAPLVGSSSAVTFDRDVFPVAVMTEFSVGFLLGCGTLVVLWAIPLAGRLLEQQHTMPTEDDENWLSGSSITRWMTLAAVVCFLTSAPIQGHLQAVVILAESFQSCPLGAGSDFITVEVASGLMQRSIELALLFAAPALSLLILMNLIIGLLGASGLTLSAINLGNAARPVVAVVVLLLCLSGFQQTLCDHLRGGLASLP